jgi:hypothetical protein
MSKAVPSRNQLYYEERLRGTFRLRDSRSHFRHQFSADGERIRSPKAKAMSAEREKQMSAEGAKI